MWYDINQTDIQNIFKFSIRGLEKLKLSYSRNSTINHSIQYYIDTLKGSLNNQPNVEEKKYLIEVMEMEAVAVEVRAEIEIDIAMTPSLHLHQIRMISPKKNTTQFFNKLKGIWNDREISIINNLLIEMESRRGNDIGSDSDTIILTLETYFQKKKIKYLN